MKKNYKYTNSLKHKRNLKKLYKNIAKSQWFKNMYYNKSLGEFIKVDK